jgi:hypothetical protein
VLEHHQQHPAAQQLAQLGAGARAAVVDGLGSSLPASLEALGEQGHAGARKQQLGAHRLGLVLAV